MLDSSDPKIFAMKSHSFPSIRVRNAMAYKSSHELPESTESFEIAWKEFLESYGIPLESFGIFKSIETLQNLTKSIGIVTKQLGSDDENQLIKPLGIRWNQRCIGNLHWYIGAYRSAILNAATVKRNSRNFRNFCNHDWWRNLNLSDSFR